MFLDPKAVFFFNQREISESSPQVHQQRNVSFQKYLRTLEELALLCRVVFARSKQQMVIGEEYITTAFHSVNSGPRFFSRGGRHWISCHRLENIYFRYRSEVRPLPPRSGCFEMMFFFFSSPLLKQKHMWGCCKAGCVIFLLGRV